MGSFVVTVWILIASQSLGNGKMLCTYDNQRGHRVQQVQQGSFCNPMGPQ